jgi:hypothetical protein
MELYAIIHADTSSSNFETPKMKIKSEGMTTEINKITPENEINSTIDSISLVK